MAYTYNESVDKYEPVGSTITGSGPMLTALSRDGSTMIVGEQSGSYTGGGGTVRPVRAYRRDPANGGSWRQWGNDMVPPEVTDILFPQHVAVSDDGTRVVVTCPGWSNSGQKQFGILVFDYDDNAGNWSVVGDTFHHSYGPRTDISGNGEYVFASSYGHHSYQDEVAASYTYVGNTWVESGAVYEIDPQHEKWGNDEEVVATTVSGSVFAFGVTSGEQRQQYDGVEDDSPSGIVHVFFDPNSQVVQSCLPDPSLLPADCTELIGEEGFSFLESDDDDKADSDDDDKSDRSTRLMPYDVGVGWGVGTIASLVIALLALS